MCFEPWILGALDEEGYNGIRDEHLSRVAKEIKASGATYVDTALFKRACYSAGVNPDNFTQADIDRLAREYLK